MTIPKNRILMLAASLALAAMPLAAQSTQGWVPYTGVTQVGHGVTQPVRAMPKASPHAGPPVQVPLLHRPSFVPSPQEPATPDTALQTVAGPSLNAVAEPGFGGVGFNGYYPPDPNSSVGGVYTKAGTSSTGHEEVVETTNVEFSVYDAATGKVLSGPTSMDTLFSSLSGTLCATNNGGDPVVLWDKIAHRWLISQLAYTNNLRSDEACIAISQTADATGKYNAYGFSFSNLTDYPKYGVWSSSSASGTSDYYFSANLFSMAKYYGPVVCAFNGADMQNGKAAEYACDQNISTSDFSLLPSDSDGATPPDVGEPNYFVELGNSSSLIMYPFLATWTGTGTGGTLNNPTAITMNVDPYTEACSGGGQCIPQPGTNEKLDSLGDRLMYRLAFRKSGSGESLVVNNSVDEGNGVVGIRWYEFTTTTTFADSVSNGSFTGKTDQGTFGGTDSNYRWMGSIAQDRNSDIALGYSESNGTSLYPSIYYTGTTSPISDTLDTENPILIGSGAETGSYRWGDYSSMSVDPADDCTFWYTNEYFNANASSVAWSTYIAPFNFSTCPTFDVSVAPTSSASATVSAGSSASYTIDLTAGTGFLGTVALSATDASSGLSTSQILINNSSSSSVDFTGSGSTSVSVSVDTTGMAAGTYTFYVVGEDGGKTNNAGGALAKGLPFTLIVTSGSGGGGSNVTVSKVTFNPNPVTGGTSTTGTVTLSGTVASNATVSLLSGNTSVATVPGSVTVSAGQSSATFPVSTTAVTTSTSVDITASYNNSQASGTLQVSAPSTGTFSVSVSAQDPTTISPGQDPTFPVTVTSNNGFSGSVSLAVTWSPSQPKFANASFSTNPVTVSATVPGTSTLTVRTNKKVTSGSYTLTITGTSGSHTSTATVYLDIQ